MVIELAQFTAKSGQAEALCAGLTSALGVFQRAEGCLGIRLLRGIEDREMFIYEIEWATLDAHTVGLRNSALFGEYRGHIAGLFEEPVVVRHYQPSEVDESTS